MISDLKKQREDLTFLWSHYDPYNFQKGIPCDVYSLLEKYHLTHIKDPFMVSNELLRMLGKCEAEIKQLEN